MPKHSQEASNTRISINSPANTGTNEGQNAQGNPQNNAAGTKFGFGLSTELMIHVGTEIIIIAGLTYWFSRQINTLNTNLQLVQKKSRGFRNINS